MDDLISRADAIDKLQNGAELLKRALDEMDIVGNEREKFAWGLGLIETCIDDLRDLPSAQPKQADDLISRVDAMAYPLSWEHYDKEHGSREFISGVESYREYIEYLPSAQLKQGEWIIDKEPKTQYGIINFECSVCGMPYSNEHRKGAKIGWWFCPNCGADMRDAETIEYHKALGDRWSGYGRRRR